MKFLPSLKTSNDGAAVNFEALNHEPLEVWSQAGVDLDQGQGDGSSWCQCYKTFFFFVTDIDANSLSVFTRYFFQAGVIFASKIGAYRSGLPYCAPL